MSGPDTPARKLLIADDHPIIVLALAEMLKVALGEHDIQIESVVDGGHLLDRLNNGLCDCVVLDMHMPGAIQGLSLLRAVLAMQPRLPVMIYTGAVQPCLAQAALEFGARAYVSKASGPQVAIEAIRAMFDGQMFVDPAIDMDAARKHPWNGLTPGERTVMVALAKGEHLDAIAIDSGRSYKTVTAHKYNALRKLGLRSRDEIGRYLAQHGLSYLLE
jgi:DNA-binding NarL/FixJ family response regulator